MKKILIIAGAVLLLVGAGATFLGVTNRNLISQQLTVQKITFAPYTADGYKDYPELKDVAGTQVTDGYSARKFAEVYMQAHILKATGGLTYSEISSKARANPDDAALQEARRTALDGATLQGNLWNTYGWYLEATYIMYAGFALLLIGGLTLLGGFLWKKPATSAA